MLFRRRVSDRIGSLMLLLKSVCKTTGSEDAAARGVSCTPPVRTVLFGLTRTDLPFSIAAVSSADLVTSWSRPVRVDVGVHFGGSSALDEVLMSSGCDRRTAMIMSLAPDGPGSFIGQFFGLLCFQVPP